MTSDMPWCAICDKPVDLAIRESRACSMTTFFKVFCHGDTDECEIDDYFFAQGEVTTVIAFNTKRITDGLPRLAKPTD